MEQFWIFVCFSARLGRARLRGKSAVCVAGRFRFVGHFPSNVVTFFQIVVPSLLFDIFCSVLTTQCCGYSTYSKMGQSNPYSEISTFNSDIGGVSSNLIEDRCHFESVAKY